jgi:hypothetical protein
VESVELALPLAETVVEVPCQVQIGRPRECRRIKPLKENKKERIWELLRQGVKRTPHASPKRKVPPFGGTFLLTTSFGCELATALALLLGLLALTVRILTIRILLLLSGLLAIALLLTGLLTRVLVLLARILVLVGHRDLPC